MGIQTKLKKTSKIDSLIGDLPEEEDRKTLLEDQVRDEKHIFSLTYKVEEETFTEKVEAPSQAKVLLDLFKRNPLAEVVSIEEIKGYV